MDNPVIHDLTPSLTISTYNPDISRLPYNLCPISQMEYYFDIHCKLNILGWVLFYVQYFKLSEIMFDFN